MVRKGKRKDNNEYPVSKIRFKKHMVKRDSQHDMPELLDISEGNARAGASFRYVIKNFSEILVKEEKISPPFYVRDLPWNIKVMQRVDVARLPEPCKTVGFFLQCNAGSENTSWRVYATAQLRIISQKKGVQSIVHKIQHLFCPKEYDWGFTFALSWEDAIDESKGFIKNDTVIFEVEVIADVPHGVNWDSKKLTGYVGLKNPGALRYMNSLLQSLYFTNQLRKAVFKIPPGSDYYINSVGLTLQCVFHKLQFYDKPVGTKELTKSLRVDTFDSFMQHNVQAFFKILLDKLENHMKGTCVEGTISKLFEGKIISYINCKNVDCTSTWTKPFYSIQLTIKGKKNIYESFRDYIQVEPLIGYKQYHAGEYGLQDAEKGVIFASFPPVLYLQLVRYKYCPINDSSVIFTNKFEFYEKINLDQYLKVKEDTPATYILHAVFVQRGYHNQGGYNVVYINPKGDGKWYRFDDEVVSSCLKEEAMEYNFGGHDGDENMMPINRCTNAYMLVYIRDSELKNVLQEVTINDMPIKVNILANKN